MPTIAGSFRSWLSLADEILTSAPSLNREAMEEIRLGETPMRFCRLRLVSRMPILAAVAALGLVTSAAAQTPFDYDDLGGLKRKSEAPLDHVPGASIEYDVLATSDGSRLRTIFSLPEDATKPPPVIYFIQWLSCSTVELRDDDGWTEMLTSLIGKSGFAVMRTEKSGVGDSEGVPCDQLDYDTEVAHHREALAALFERDDIDPRNVFVFGGSMGAHQAPLVAARMDVAGVIAWGGGANTWYQRMLGFDRRSLELGGEDPDKIEDILAARARFYDEYLLRRRAPPDIIADHPKFEAVWDGMIGTSDTAHYGRPFAFHHQAQYAHGRESPWAAISAPVLVMYGEYDWFEDEAGHRAIVNTINALRPGTADFIVLPQTNHHFSRYPDRVSAFEEEGGEMVGDAAAALIEQWIYRHLR